MIFAVFQVFSKHGLLYKVSRHRQTTDPALKDGITQGELWDLLQGFFTRNLGDGDHNAIIEKALEFADFNNDDTVGDNFKHKLQIRLLLKEKGFNEGDILFEPHCDKTNKMSVHPAKTQISLGIHPV